MEKNISHKCEKKVFLFSSALIKRIQIKWVYCLNNYKYMKKG